MSVVDDSFQQPLKDEEDASAPLAGGLVNHGFQCGILWGAVLAAGAQAHRHHGSGPAAEASAMLAAESLVDSFEASNGFTDCADLTEMNFRADNPGRSVLKFLMRGGPVGCFHMVARYAPVAHDVIENTLVEQPPEMHDSPVSCTAVLAGFAGGIGLSGGTCGALGAAIWIMAMNDQLNSSVKLDYETSEALAAIDRFVEASDYEFECQQIVGRKFQSIEDHANHVRNGGCAEIIEALASL
jgi:hypothetical protein